MPSAATRRRRRAPPGRGFGNAVGQPIGSASDAGSSPIIGSMCSYPSAAAARRAAPSPTTRRRVDDAVRRRRRRPERGADGHRAETVVVTSASTSASPCRPAGGAGRALVEVAAATSAGVQPPSLPHPRDLLRVLEDRVRVLGAAEDLTVDVPGLLRREERDERRVQRGVLLGRRFVPRCARTAPRSCGSRPTGAIAFTVMP